MSRAHFGVAWSLVLSALLTSCNQPLPAPSSPPIGMASVHLSPPAAEEPSRELTPVVAAASEDLPIVAEPAAATSKLNCLPVVVAEYEGKVIGITDGDTIKVLTDDKQALTIRLEGLDAPERGQEHGARAKEALDRLAGQQRVIVKKTGADKYNRTLATVFVRDLNVNAKLVEDGWAWHYKQYNCDERLAALEDAARSAKRGLWAHERPMPPWEYRHLNDRKAAVTPAPATSPITSSPARSQPPSGRPEVSVAQYWLNTASNVRHNSSCKHFGNTKKGRSCGPSEGKACGICGG